MDSLVQRARERFAELNQILKAAEDVREEWKDLAEFLSNASKVEARLGPSAKSPEQPRPVGGNGNAPVPKPQVLKPRTENSGEFLDYVFEKHGPKLHIEEFIELMIKYGWPSSGDVRKDYKNCYQMLNSRPKQYQRVGRGIFEKKSQEDTVSR